MPEFGRFGAARSSDETIIVRRSGPVLVPAGAVVGHTYAIERLLARGNLGDVYRARHVELGTLHAVTLVPPSVAANPQSLKLLIDEARKLERVRDDAVIAHQGLFRGENDVRYLVTEYPDGDSLATICERRRFEPDEVLRLRDRLAQGPAAAHEKGVIHGNLSPGSVVLPDGDVSQAKLVGFGLARCEPGDATIIGSKPAGSDAFLSPEQIGLFGGRLDARSDIYSLGLVLAAAALGFGRKLDMGATPTAAIAARQKLPDLAALPERLRPVVKPLLQPRPEDRPGSMRQVLESTGKEPSAGDDGQAPIVPASPKARRPLVAGIGAAALVAAVAVGAVVVWRLLLPPPSMEQLRRQIATVTGSLQCASADAAIAADGSVRLSGYVSRPEDIQTAQQRIANVPGVRSVASELRLMTWPHCQIAAIFRSLPAFTGRDAPSLALRTHAPRAGDPLIIDVRAPAFDGYLYIDYFDGDGEVQHLFPTVRDRLNLKPAYNHFVLGCPPLTELTLGGKPGERIVTLIATSEPLFPDPLLATEHARDYLATLSGLIGGGSGGGGPPISKAAAATMSFDLRGTDAGAAAAADAATGASPDAATGASPDAACPAR